MGDSLLDEELDFSLSPVKRSTAKQGRRAGAGLQDQEGEDTFQMAASPLRSRPMTGGEILLEDSAPRKVEGSAPPRRTGGWGEDTRVKTAKSVYREPVQVGPRINTVLQDTAYCVHNTA